MSGKQWTILSVAAAVLSVSALFPPWLYKCEWQEFSAGYHFFMKPPEPLKIDSRCTSSDPGPGPPATLHMNIHRLVWQNIVVIVLSVGLILIARTPRTNLSVVSAVLILSLGVVGSMFLGLMIQFER